MTRRILGIGAAILLLWTGVSFGAEQFVQNGTVDGSIRVSVQDLGRMAAWRFGGGAWVKQTYGVNSKYSLLFLDGDNPAMVFGGGRTGSLWIPVSNTTNADGTEITTVFRTPDGGVRVTQRTTVTSGPYYRMQWDIENLGPSTYSDVRFTHGEDTYLGGSDYGEGHYDNTLKMVYIANVVSGTADLMGIYASGSTPFQFFFEGYYSENQTRMASWTLNDTTDPGNVDSGYSLGWTRSTLAPGQSWTIIAYEKFTRAAGVQVNAPAEQSGAPGSTVTYNFTVRNLDAATRSVALSATSANGWDTAVMDASGNPLPAISLDGGAEAPVYVRVAIPAGAPAETADLLTLSAGFGEAEESYDSTTTVAGSSVAVPPSALNLSGQGPDAAGGGCSVVSGPGGGTKQGPPESAAAALFHAALLLGPVFLLRHVRAGNRRA